MEENWRNEKWFTSPWNFNEVTTRHFRYPEKIEFHDVTLRDGEQQAGIAFSADEKIALAEKMTEMGIHRIEAGMPAVSKEDEYALREIVKRCQGKGRNNTQIYAFSRSAKADIDLALDCGINKIMIEIPASDHMLRYGYEWDMQHVIEMASEATRYAHEKGLYVSFFPVDGTRADYDSFVDMITQIDRNGHIDSLVIVDTLGVMAPHACAYMTKSIKSILNKPIEVHFHDDFRLGAANSLMALMNGATVVHTSITGIGQRAGNVAYEDVVMSLLTMYNYDCGFDYSMMNDLSRLMCSMSGHTIAPNRGILGDLISKLESGILTKTYLNSRDKLGSLEVAPFDYNIVGHEDVDIVLGKMNGMPNVDYFLDRIGVTCTDKDAKKEILTKVKETSGRRKRNLRIDEFRTIADKVLGPAEKTEAAAAGEETEAVIAGERK